MSRLDLKPSEGALRETEVPAWPETDRAKGWPDDPVMSVLAQVSRYLVSSSGADLGRVLEMLGEALQTDEVYFVATPDLTPPVMGPLGIPLAPTYLSDQVVTWTRGGGVSYEGIRNPADGTARLGEDDGSGDAMGPDGTIAVPLLTEDEQAVGYLGIGRSRLGNLARAPYDRVLSVVGDVLGTHLSRLALEEARGYTEQRWRQLVDRHPDPTLVVAQGIIGYANTAAARLFGVAGVDDLMKRPFDDFLSAEDITRVTRARNAQLALTTPVPFEHDVIRIDGDVRTIESLSVPFPGVDEAVQTVLRDLTDRREGEQRYRTFVQTTSDGVWRVHLDVPLPRGGTTRAQVSHVLSHGRFAELNPAMIRVLGADRQASLDVPLRRLVRPCARRLIEALVASGYDLRNQETSVRDDGDTRHFSVNAIGRFERDNLVEVWGSCTEITDRVEMERRLVAVLEDQQERIGRDLHDSVGQLLTGVRMLSESLAAREQGGDHADTAGRIAAYAAEALERVRAICHGLVPPQLYSEGAAGALAELVEHVDQLGPVRCVFRRDGTADLLDPAAALQAYRISQEAVSNALRHGGGTTIWVTLGRDGDDVVVEIEDDGQGFVLSAERSRSIGLYGMTRRAHSVGATLAVETSPGAGTTVRATFSEAAQPLLAKDGEEVNRVLDEYAVPSPKDNQDAHQETQRLQ